MFKPARQLQLAKLGTDSSSTRERLVWMMAPAVPVLASKPRSLSPLPDALSPPPQPLPRARLDLLGLRALRLDLPE